MAAAAPPAPPAPAAGSAAGFQQTIDRVAAHMDSDDSKAVSASAVTLALMLQSTQLPADLSRVVARLAGFLEPGAAEAAVQRNAAAALSASVESNDSAVRAAIENRVAERAVALLESGGAEEGTRLNLLVLLGTLGEAGEATAQLVLDAGGLQQLLGAADAAASDTLQEAAVDGVCKLSANFVPAKDAAVAAGAIPALSSLLGSGSSSAEVKVRALLALGMLTTTPARQLELAGTPGAVAALLRLTRQQDDADLQQVAASVFRELAANPEAKGAIAAALKEQQAAVAAGTKFV